MGIKGRSGLMGKLIGVRTANGGEWLETDKLIRDRVPTSKGGSTVCYGMKLRYGTEIFWP